MVRQTSKWGQLLLIALIGVGATAFATAWFYRIDEIITVQGKLVPARGGVEVKSPTSAQIQDIYVNNGALISKGENIFRFDVEGALSLRRTLNIQLDIEQKRLLQSLESVNQRVETLKRNIDLKREIFNRLNLLESSGAISEIQLLQQENSLLSQEDDLLQLLTKKDQILTESKSRTAELNGKLSQIEFQLKNEYVTAPISGIIFDLKPDSSGYFVRQSEPLVKIVPTGNLAGEVNLANRDIGFVRKGQDVKIRIDSFPYTEYGEINGTISRVGADALPPTQLQPQYHFPIYLNLDKSHLVSRNGSEIPLQSGMTITTNLKLRDRRLIELLSDLFANKGDSLKRLRQP